MPQTSLVCSTWQRAMTSWMVVASVCLPTIVKPKKNKNHRELGDARPQVWAVTTVNRCHWGGGRWWPPTLPLIWAENDARRCQLHNSLVFTSVCGLRRNVYPRKPVLAIRITKVQDRELIKRIEIFEKQQLTSTFVTGKTMNIMTRNIINRVRKPLLQIYVYAHETYSDKGKV